MGGNSPRKFTIHRFHFWTIASKNGYVSKNGTKIPQCARLRLSTLHSKIWLISSKELKHGTWKQSLPFLEQGCYSFHPPFLHTNLACRQSSSNDTIVFWCCRRIMNVFLRYLSFMVQWNVCYSFTLTRYPTKCFIHSTIWNHALSVTIFQHNVDWTIPNSSSPQIQ